MRQTTRAIIVFLFSLQTKAVAQLQIQPVIGTGFYYAHTENISSNFKSVIKPNGGLMIHIPVTGKMQLQSGLIFLQKGYNSGYKDTSVQASATYAVQNVVNYLSIPLLASYNVYAKSDFQYWIDAGLNYDFFISGKSHFKITSYLNDVPTSIATFDHSLNGPLIRQDTDPNTGRDDLTGLDISFRLQLHVVWSKHYTASIYWDNGLYNILANPADASYISLHSFGVSIGYVIL